MEYCVLKKSSYWCFIFWGNAIVTVFFLIRFFSCFDIFDGSTAISDIASVLLWTGPGGSTSVDGTYIVLAFLFWNLKKINFFVSLFPRLSQDAFRTPETWFFSSQCFYSVLYIYTTILFYIYFCFLVYSRYSAKTIYLKFVCSDGNILMTLKDMSDLFRVVLTGGRVKNWSNQTIFRYTREAQYLETRSRW